MLDKSRDISDINELILLEIVPIREFEERFMKINDVSLLKEEGMVPVNIFPSRERNPNCVKALKLLGITSINLFPPSFKSFRLIRLPNDVGMSPPNAGFALIDRRFNDFNDPIECGIVPVKEF